MYVLNNKIPGFLGVDNVPLLNLGQTSVSQYDMSTSPITEGEVEWMLEQQGYFEIQPAQATPQIPTSTSSPYTPTPVTQTQAPISTKSISRYDAVKYGVDRAVWKWELENARGLGFSLWDAVVQYAIQEGNKYLNGLVSSMSGMKISGLSGLGADDSSVWDWGGWSYVILMLGSTLTTYGQYKLQQDQLENIKSQAQMQTGQNIPSTISESDYTKIIAIMKTNNPNLSEAEIRNILKGLGSQKLPSESSKMPEWLTPVLLIAGVVLLTRKAS